MTTTAFRAPVLALAAGLAMTVVPAGSTQAADEIVRYPLPNNSTFPISRSVMIPAGAELLYVSGQVPPVVDPDAEPGSRAAYGNTEQQTIGVIERIQAALADAGMTLHDVVKMQVYLVADPENDNEMDFAGFMAGYTQFFGTAEQPNLPARSAFQIAGLAVPGWLVEIEVVAARMPE